jgi:Na+/H+-translocating membrane pyrophosphatase
MNKDINIFLESIEYKSIIVNICVAVSLMAIFLTVFYFYYVLEIEHGIVSDNVNIMTFNLLDSIKPFLTPHTKNYIQQKLKKIDMSEQDAKVEASNNAIKSDAIKQMSIITVVCIVIGYILAQYYNINFYDILINNTLILVLLGLTEYTFLHILPSKIMTGDPNFIKYKVFVNMKNKIKYE